MPEVAVVNYGMGNLLSVRRGLEYCGATVTVTADPDTILSAPRVVLTGVGAFATGMAELLNLGLDTVVQKVAAQGSFLLGICLGMQMLLDESEDFGTSEGLGIIPGRVVPVPSTTINGLTQKIPHIGWSNLILSKGIETGKVIYFKRFILGKLSILFTPSWLFQTTWIITLPIVFMGGGPIPATIGRDNIYGCQFHPEKSGGVGLKILRKFLSL